MSDYIQLPITQNPDDIAESMYTRMTEFVPGWEPADGNLDVWIMQTTARIVADLAEIATDVPDTIFRFFGERILQVPFKDPTNAYFTATVTAVDDQGYTLPGATNIGVRRSHGDLVAFQSVGDTVIPPGDTSVTDVLFVAIEGGAETSGLDTSIPNIRMIDPLPWVSSIEGDAITVGGEDGEDEDEYMDRLVDEARLMSPRPIVPVDFATMARRIDGVDRAYYINLYNAQTNTPNQEKCITLVVTDEDGEPVNSQTRADVDALLQSQREVNMLVFVVDAQYQSINVAWQVSCLPGYTPSDVQGRVTTALTTYLSPLEWGRVSEGTDPQAALLWRVQNRIRYLEVSQVINNVEGVDYITSLTINGGSTDVIMDPGSGVPVVLPRPGSITGSALASTD